MHSETSRLEEEFHSLSKKYFQLVVMYPVTSIWDLDQAMILDDQGAPV
jgi:hypothetical protein